MNFLAHSLLGFENPALIAGQFCGDFVRGGQLSRFPPTIELGIRLHRHLDAFTDAHSLLQPVRSRFGSSNRRFAGIVIDVLLDHYLANNWADHSKRSLEEHALMVHAALEVHRPVLPERLQRFMQVLHSEQLLQANVEMQAVERTLARLSRRSERFSALALPVTELGRLSRLLEIPFAEFYPELRTAALNYLEQREAGER